MTYHPIDDTRVTLIITHRDLREDDRGGGKGQAVREAVVRAEEAHTDITIFDVGFTLYGDALFEDPEEAYLTRGTALYMVKECVHELTHEVGAQTLRLKGEVNTCATCWAYVARDMAVSAFALIDVPIDHDISDTAVEGEVSLQRADVDALDMECWRGDGSRSDDLPTLEAGRSGAREVGIDHVEAHAC